MKRLLGALILSAAMLTTSISFAAEQSIGVTDNTIEQKPKPAAAAATAPKKKRKTYGSNKSSKTVKKSSTRTTNPGTTTK